MNEVDINAIKFNLKNIEQDLLRRLKLLNKDKTRSRGPIAQDFSDQAQETENDQVIDHLETIDLKQIDQVQAALKRIESGTYGRCLECEETIAPARLKALPYASRCIKCHD